MISKKPSKVVGVWMTGFIGTVALVAIWHVLGLASRPQGAGYVYTQYLSTCFSWTFVAVFVGISGILGWTFAQTWPVAGGMVTPWLVALVVEIGLDPTSHNLFPFEILFYWCPVFLLSLAGAFAGRAARNGRHPEPDSHLFPQRARSANTEGKPPNHR
jgi:hypothetical protein